MDVPFRKWDSFNIYYPKFKGVSGEEKPTFNKLQFNIFAADCNP